jgi:hypothetical protein
MNAVPTSSLRSISTRVWPASRSTVTAAVAVTTLAVAVGWLYSSVVPALVRQWAADDDYSHGFFVAPLALFFAWERRDALREASRRPHALGLVILAVSLLCYVAGQFGSELFLTRVSLIGVLAGLVLFIAGSEHFRILAFPLAFLLLMVPLPAIIFNRRGSASSSSRRAAFPCCVKATCFSCRGRCSRSLRPVRAFAR